MICTCPKCNATFEMDLAQVGETGTATKCNACKARLQISREPFVRRAYRKAAELSCAHCGGQLGHYLNCPSCGILYPDYYVAETPDAIRKRTRKVSGSFRSLKNISFEWRSAPAKEHAYRPAVVTATAAPQAPVRGNRQALTRVLGLLALIALLAGGYLFYTNHQSKRKFASNYVRAVYVIKTGTELNLKTSARITAEWRAKAGGPAPRITADEEAKLVKLRDEVEKIQPLLVNPPTSFVPAVENLTKLKEAYSNLNNLTVAPPNAQNVFEASLGKAESDYRKAVHLLKSNLPPELSEELTKAKTKYKALADF